MEEEVYGRCVQDFRPVPRGSLAGNEPIAGSLDYGYTEEGHNI
jgi:hypothetical protein